MTSVEGQTVFFDKTQIAVKDLVVSMIAAHFIIFIHCKHKSRVAQKMAAIMGRLCWRKPSKRGQTHVAETGWIVSWRSLLDLVRTNNETKTNKNIRRMVMGLRYQSLWLKPQKLKGGQKGKRST